MPTAHEMPFGGLNLQVFLLAAASATPLACLTRPGVLLMRARRVLANHLCTAYAAQPSSLARSSLWQLQLANRNLSVQMWYAKYSQTRGS